MPAPKGQENSAYLSPAWTKGCSVCALIGGVMPALFAASMPVLISGVTDLAKGAKPRDAALPKISEAPPLNAPPPMPKAASFDVSGGSPGRTPPLCPNSLKALPAAPPRAAPGIPPAIEPITVPASSGISSFLGFNLSRRLLGATTGPEVCLELDSVNPEYSSHGLISAGCGP